MSGVSRMTNLQYCYPQQTLFLRLRDITSRCRDESDNSGISILGNSTRYCSYWAQPVRVCPAKETSMFTPSFLNERQESPSCYPLPCRLLSFISHTRLIEQDHQAQSRLHGLHFSLSWDCSTRYGKYMLCSNIPEVSCI